MVFDLWCLFNYEYLCSAAFFATLTKEEFLKKVSDIFDCGILTNQGPNVQEFEQTIQKFLGVEYFHYVTNGTIALQLLALHALGITEGEVITTPFSYVATISSGTVGALCACFC